ncbi:hypothetical protein INS49_000116 [Diaporthe citri]|uniref:uncharacterized protein n=1 Tax=Diaporthe citri TaxID=83186 RepID=UPI001C7EF26F|nr:uncharacterized protein INS49_000116 [Diaporthe citri]KAG6365940.1 hypothetical protein INS49_000116 [Diaporthe citri]
MNSAEAKEAKEAEQAAHYALIEQLDIHSIHKSFRNPSWRPNQRRNKNIKTILGDASRREASLAVTPMDNGSGAATPNDAARDDDKDDGLSTSGTSTPANDASSTPGGAGGTPSSSQPNLAQASRSLATYTNIESAPSLAPQKRYCDVTGLPAPYQDPKTRLRYHDKEVFAMIRGLPQGYAEQYLEARGAHTVLK